jgi:hypothetical protein
MNPQSHETVHWDVALEALLNERFQKLGHALSLLELKRLSGQFAVRLDDILETLCKLYQHGLWEYRRPEGSGAEPDGDMCRLLHANHRLNDIQLERLDGSWRPITQD